MHCRHCKKPLEQVLIDLGSAPPSNAYLTKEDLKKPEKWYPLRVLVCNECWLVQTEDFAQANDLFDENYSYFSGYSSSWLGHAERYVKEMAERFHLTTKSHVVEIAANDGYLLQFVNRLGIPCLGVEPTASTAAAARAKGIQIVGDFFGVHLAQQLAAEGKHADLTVANNVLAHVPDINDFVRGFPILLKRDGVSTFEFPHLMRMIAENQFDTIYHEHFSYLSFTAVVRILEQNGLAVFDVTKLPTHGGSLRVFAQRSDTGKRRLEPSVAELLIEEEIAGIRSTKFYSRLQIQANRIKDDLMTFLLDAKRRGKLVVGYGAAAKGNTLLNYAGIRSDLLPFVVDRSPSKQGKFLPGSRIPVVSEEELKLNKPDFILILPWNLSDEIEEQLCYAREWGAEFVKSVPRLEVLNGQKLQKNC